MDTKKVPVVQAGYHTMTRTGLSSQAQHQQGNCSTELSQSQILTLADTLLAQANEQRSRWLTTGSEQDWRLWREAMRARLAVLRQAEVGDE